MMDSCLVRRSLARGRTCVRATFCDGTDGEESSEFFFSTRLILLATSSGPHDLFRILLAPLTSSSGSLSLSLSISFLSYLCSG